MALKDESKPIYLKVVDAAIIQHNEQIKFIIGALEFQSQADRQAWETGAKVYQGRLSFEIYLDNQPEPAPGWSGNGSDWLKMLAYQAMKNEAAQVQYPELVGLQDA